MVGTPVGLTLGNWDLGGGPSEWAYRHAGELFEAVEIAPGRQVVALEVAESAEVAAFPVEAGMSLDGYVADAAVDGIVIVHDGQVVYERYPRMRPDERHLLMSVTKLVPAVLVGVLERRGLLDLDRLVDTVVAELAGGGWAGVPIRDVLGMASGIDCPEVGDPGAYTDPGHPFYRFEASLGWRPGNTAISTYELVAGLPARRPPGRVYEYTSVNTFVLSWIVERVTGLSFADAVEREIWSHGGFEAPAQLCVAPTSGAPASHGGLSTTLRDLARFGMLFTPSRHLLAPQPVVDDEHLRRIQSGGRPHLHREEEDLPALAHAAFPEGLPPASRQWNHAMADGDLFKSGFGGQGLYVSPHRDLVIAFTGTPAADGTTHDLRWHTRHLASMLFSRDRQ